MIDYIFTFSNLLFAFAICATLYLRLKYRRFGNIPKWWEKFGWFTMLIVVVLLLGEVAKSLLKKTTEDGLKITIIGIATYFVWYLVTIHIVTKKKIKK